MDWLSRIFAWLSDHEAGISAVVGIAVLAGIVFTSIRFLLSRHSEASGKIEPEEDPLLALPTGPVVAVLPFENLSGDPDQEYFSDGLTDDIITALSRFKDLFVIARNSTFRYKGQAVDVRQIQKELGARYVLEGSVQRAESRLRVTVQLLDAKDGTHLWAERYDRELSVSDIFEVQDGITERVVAILGGNLGVISRTRIAEVKQKPTDHLDAYESVLKWGAYSIDNIVASEHLKVRGALERAVKSDASYSDAWACLCLIYLHEYTLRYNPRPNPLDRALDAAKRAVALDATSQWAHHALAMAYFHLHDLDKFFVEAERAIALNPNSTYTLAELGQSLQFAGDDRGIALVNKAMKLDPFHPSWYNFAVAYHCFTNGEYEAALAAVNKIQLALPDHFWLPLYLAGIYSELDRQGEARSAIEELLGVDPEFTIERFFEESRKFNLRDDATRRWASALREAGLPE